MGARELLFSVTKKDLEISWFSGTGAGGQHRNKHQNCVRLHHPASGARVTGQSNKERKSNIREALNNLVKNPKFKLWMTREVNEKLTGKRLEEVVDEMMAPENLRFEGKNEQGQWEEME
jgi:protein subunit release factor B